MAQLCNVPINPIIFQIERLETPSKITRYYWVGKTLANQLKRELTILFEGRQPAKEWFDELTDTNQKILNVCRFYICPS